VDSAAADHHASDAEEAPKEAVADHPIDALARRWVVCDGLQDLLLAEGGYRPSLYPDKGATPAEVKELRTLADAYDAAQEARGDARRAHRGEPGWWAPRKQPPVKVGGRSRSYAALAAVQRLARARLGVGS